MELKLLAGMCLLCLLVCCSPLCESRPVRRINCIGLIKHQSCPSSSIGFNKRLLDNVMTRAEANEANEDRDWNEELRGDDGTRTGWTIPADEDAAAQLDAREKEEELLRRKELQLLFVRALIDDLENETLNNM